MFSPISENNGKSNFYINDIVFAKIKGYPTWPAKVTHIDKLTHKNAIKYEVIFFETNETAVINKSNIYSFKENKIKYSVDTVAKKYKESYASALYRAAKEFNSYNRLIKSKNMIKSDSETLNMSLSNSILLSEDQSTREPLNKKVSDKSASVMTQTDISSILLSTCSELLGDEWLTDNTIHKYFEMLTDKLKLDACFHIFNPIISHALKSVHDYNHFLDYLDLKNKKYLIIPINDAQELEKNGGSHWSLLVLIMQESTFYYLDSSGNHNIQHAKIVMKKLTTYLGPQLVEPKLIVLECAQQINSYDCGIYVIMTVEELLVNFLTIGELDMCNFRGVAPHGNDLIKKRSVLAYLFLQHNKLNKEAIFSLLEENFFIGHKEEVSHNNLRLLTQRIKYLEKELEEKTAEVSKLMMCNETLKNETDEVLKIKEMIRNPYTEYPNDCNKTLQKRLQTAINFLSNETKLFWENNKELIGAVNSHLTLIPNKNNYTKEKNKNSLEMVKQIDKGIASEKFRIKQPNIRGKYVHKITLMSDSQGRDIMSYLNTTDDVTQVFGHVQPGAPMEAVFSAAMREMELNKYTRNDCLVLIGGCNNVSNLTINKERLSVEKMLHFIKGKVRIFEKTNLILSTIPYRYDLWEDDPKNILIRDINNGIRDIVYANPYIQLLDLYLLQRSYQTRHGLHINRRGKKFVAFEILQLVENTRQQHKEISTTSNKFHKAESTTPTSVSLPTNESTVVTSVCVSEAIHNASECLHKNQAAICSSTYIEQNEETGHDLNESFSLPLADELNLIDNSSSSNAPFLAESCLVISPLK